MRSLLWPRNSKTLFYIPGFIFVPPHDPTVGSVSFNLLSFLFEVSSNKFWTELPSLPRRLPISLQCRPPPQPRAALPQLRRRTGLSGAGPPQERGGGPPLGSWLRRPPHPGARRRGASGTLAPQNQPEPISIEFPMSSGSSPFDATKAKGNKPAKQSKEKGMLVNPKAKKQTKDKKQKKSVLFESPACESIIWLCLMLSLVCSKC